MQRVNQLLRSWKVRIGLAVTLAVVLVASVVIGTRIGKAQAPAPVNGLLCTQSTSTTPHTASFTLTAEAGYISMADGNAIWSWSYANSQGGFQFPGPYLCVNEGDTVTIVLHNNLTDTNNVLLPNERTSIMFPGISGVTANGAPAQPEFTGPTITSLTTSAAPGASVTYSFVAAHPGTYLYESGTDQDKQVQMGLYGAIVVKPTAVPTAAQLATDPNGACAYDNCQNSFYDGKTEFVLILGEVDPFLHQAVELGNAYDATQLHPRYWLINGRTFPDTIAPNNAAWLPAQPYGSLVHVGVYDTVHHATPAPALVRYLNAGSLNHPFHPHGENGTVIARDANQLVDASGDDLSYETFAFSIGSGQTWDELYRFENQEQYDATTNPIPVTLPSNLSSDLTFKGNATYYSGSPYLGNQAKFPIGVTSFNQCGEFYMVWHSHALNEVANYDTSFGGMLTLERIDPAPGYQATGTTCTP